MGGLVTTYGAGMAVPDWPNTFTYNLFLYPLERWLYVGDVFLEHSHRLIGAAVGTVTILLCGALWLWDRRSWMRSLGLIALAGVLFQGLLGGLRVIGNEVFLAKVHGCTAPVFFALTAAMVAFTSPRWKQPLAAVATAAGPALRRFRRLALVLTVAVWVQIVLGANVRHLTPETGTGWFRLCVWLHLIVAGLDSIGVAWLLALALRHLRARPMLVRRAKLLAGLFVVQLALGIFTWLTRYGIPAWFAEYFWGFEYTVEAGTTLQLVVITAHVAVGSLALVTALSARLWSMQEGDDGQKMKDER